MHARYLWHKNLLARVLCHCPDALARVSARCRAVNARFEQFQNKSTRVPCTVHARVPCTVHARVPCTVHARDTCAGKPPMPGLREQVCPAARPAATKQVVSIARALFGEPPLINKTKQKNLKNFVGVSFQKIYF